jgi:hypothetical protein
MGAHGSTKHIKQSIEFVDGCLPAISSKWCPVGAKVQKVPTKIPIDSLIWALHIVYLFWALYIVNLLPSGMFAHFLAAHDPTNQTKHLIKFGDACLPAFDSKGWQLGAKVFDKYLSWQFLWTIPLFCHDFYLAAGSPSGKPEHQVRFCSGGSNHSSAVFALVKGGNPLVTKPSFLFLKLSGQFAKFSLSCILNWLYSPDNS